MNFLNYIVLFLLLSGLFACTSKTPTMETEPALYQVSTIDALLQGVYDGNTTLGDLSAKGDFGIGTFNALDGELVLEDGTFYQVKADGQVYRPSAELKTPFASVVEFSPEDSLAVQDISYAQLKQLIDSLMGSPNYFYAVRLEGMFKSVHTRSVPAQGKPYRDLVEVTRNQPEFNISETRGKLTGFFCPEFVKGINITGYHLHYLSDDKSAGGHLLDFQLKSGMLKLDRIQKFEMQLPETDAFRGSEFTTDRTEQVTEVEGK